MKYLITLMLLCSLSAYSQEKWRRMEGTDSFANIPTVTFSLTGKFLTPPSSSRLDAPTWITVCTPKASHNGKNLYDGQLMKSYIDFGTVLHSATLSQVAVSYRLDDSKAKTELWLGGSAGTAAFLDHMALNTVLYDHYFPHRANSSPPHQKLVIMVQESLAGNIVAEFDMPDPDEMARACGITYHRD